MVLPDRTGTSRSRIEPMSGQRQQTRLFFRESFRYRAMIASGPGAAVRFPVSPCKSLAVEVPPKW